MQLRIRCQHVLGATLDRVVRLRVFCPSQERSLAFEECSRCPRMEALPPAPDQPGASITCAPGPPPLHPAPRTRTSLSSLGAVTVIGAVVGPQLGSVRPELPLSELRRAFAEWGGTQLAVVDENGLLLGTVWREDFVSQRPPPLSGLALDPGRVANRMGRASSLREDEPLSRAVETVVRDHARTLFVVDREGAVTGALGDLDLLRWLTQERRRLEGQRER